MPPCRIVPEYSFLDARGVGAFDRGLLEIVAADLARGDALSPDWRPPPGAWSGCGGACPAFFRHHHVCLRAPLLWLLQDAHATGPLAASCMAVAQARPPKGHARQKRGVKL